MYIMSTTPQSTLGLVCSAGLAARHGLSHVSSVEEGTLNSRESWLWFAEGWSAGSYYPATSTSQLDSALRTIAKAVTSCSFKTDKAPVDKDLVHVYFDGKLVDQDPDNGWTFESADSSYSTITLTGTYCQNVLAGSTSKVDIVLYQ